MTVVATRLPRPGPAKPLTDPDPDPAEQLARALSAVAVGLYDRRGWRSTGAVE